jgi:DNA-binding NarL/FixJ family response regulator
MNFFRKYRRPEGPSAVDEIAQLMLRPKRVLFVDDNQALRYFMEGEIAPKFRVNLIWASSASEARSLITESVEPFEAAILDVVLANGSGLDLYRKLLQASPHTQVVFLTGNDSPGLRKAIDEIGPARVYSKDRIIDFQFARALFSQFRIPEIYAPPMPV